MNRKVVVSVAVSDCRGCGRWLVPTLRTFTRWKRPLQRPLRPRCRSSPATVAQHDVPIYLTGVGTVIAYNTDVVRAQIQGQIISINFTEGQTVHAGDLLAQIDPRPTRP